MTVNLLKWKKMKKVWQLFIFAFFGLIFLFAEKEAVFAQACINESINQSEFKDTDTVILTAQSSTQVNGFYFEVRNFANPDTSGIPQIVCTSTPNEAGVSNPGCPAGKFPLIFKDPNTSNRTTGSRTLTPAELFQFDWNMYKPNGGYPLNQQIWAYVAQGNNPWSPAVNACKVNANYYRPYVCSSSSISSNTLTPGNPVQITINGSPPAGTTISKFWLAFYNGDNLYGPGNAKGYCVDNGIGDNTTETPGCPAGSVHYLISADNTSSSNSHTFTLNYSDFQYPDRNWSNQIPTNIQTNGYFLLDDSGWSRPEPPCVRQFNVQANGASITPSPTPTPAVSITPVPSDTPTPTPPLGWYAPDGTSCNHKFFFAYYTNNNCSGSQTGYAVEGIPTQETCNTDGTGTCHKIAGLPYNLEANSYWRSDTQACIPIDTGPTVPANAFDTLYQCAYGQAPNSQIAGTVTLNFYNKNQWDSVYIWINDVENEVFYDKIEFKKKDIINGQPIGYSFKNLYPGKKYDLYVKAYGIGGVYLDDIPSYGSCGAALCRQTAPSTADFTLTFPQPQAGFSSIATSNEDYAAQIEKWIKGQIGPLEMSQFIFQVQRVPGLQKETCDPTIPNGCNTL